MGTLRTEDGSMGSKLDCPMNRSGTAAERLILAVTGMMFLAPLSIFLLLHFIPSALPHATWLRNQTLSGVVAKEPTHELSWSAVKSGRYQEGLARWFNTNFAGRELLIRLTCEGWYRSFRQSPLAAGIILGKDDYLFAEPYLTEYCLDRGSTQRLEMLAADMRRMQDACDGFGLAFLFLITPSKPSVMPEYIPQAWLQRYDQRPRAYDQLLPLLRDHGVRYVDGHVLSVEAKADAQSSVFPKGGVHWGAYPAWKTTNAVINALAAQGKPLKPIRVAGSQVADLPEGFDADLLTLMNLAVPWRYPVTNLTIEPQSLTATSPKIVMVGASFATEVARQISASSQVAEVDHYFYYNLEMRSIEKGTIRVERNPVGWVDFDREIFASDCVILECNELDLGVRGRDYLATFLKDALHHLTSARSSDRPPSYGSRDAFKCGWGQEVSFKSADHPFGPKRACLRGFGECEEKATWTVRSSASIALSVPASKEDVLLAADAGAFLAPPKLDVQEVKVFANGLQVGVWRFTEGVKTRQSAVIPRAAIGVDGSLVLCFEIANPTTPQSLGMGDDDRKLGIWLSSLRIDQVSHPGI